MITQLTLPFVSPDPLSAESIRLARSAHAKRTVDGYAADWALYVTWCGENSKQSIPATTNTVVLYITHVLTRGCKITTAKRHLCAIMHEHRKAGYESPLRAATQAIITGAQRLRTEQPKQKTPIGVEELRRMIGAIDRPEPYKSRDRALLLVGFASALRRSSIVELCLNDIEFTASGLIIRVRREKQDQTGVGRTIGIPFGSHPTCPVAALRVWLGQRGTEEGPLFPSLWHQKIDIRQRMRGDTVARIVKRAIQAIGLDPAGYSGHSLRAGFVTSALEQGAGEILTARHTGHRSLQTLKLYLRPQDPFRANACACLGL